MPKIAEIEDTPNPNAVKFIHKEPLTWASRTPMKTLSRRRRQGCFDVCATQQPKPSGRIYWIDVVPAGCFLCLYPLRGA